MKTRNHAVPGLNRLIRRRSPRVLASSAGQIDAVAGGGFEALENRILLGGDHPSFMRPLLPNASGTLVDVAGDGEGVAQGTIGTIGDDDLFRFRMPGNAGETDFVTILADTTSTGSSVNTRVEVYDQMGRMVVGPDVVGREGFDNGLLSSGMAEDGWGGFIARAGETYFVRVIGEGFTTGDYQLRINTRTIEFPLDLEPFTPEGDPNPNFGMGQIVGELGPVDDLEGIFQQDEIVYRLDIDPGMIEEEFIEILRSVASANAKIARDDNGNIIDSVDTHLEIYDAAGNLIDSDRQGGRLTNAFVVWRSNPEQTFYIRVRSDVLVPASNDPQLDQSAGQFNLVVNAFRRDVEIDMVTRLGPADIRGVLADGTDSNIWSFVPQGTGTTFITVIGLQVGFIPPLPDPAITLYNEAGEVVAFVDDFNGLNAQIEVELVGGERYFLLVEGFDDDAGGGYGVFIEAQHTHVESEEIDDHIDTPTSGTPDEIRRRFQEATPLIFNHNNPFLMIDADGNPVRDRSWMIGAMGHGRIYENGDTDLFQFTAPVDMLSDYEGDNDDAGTALFLGGIFGQADPNDPVPVDSRNLTIWDANDYWFVGRQRNGDGEPVLGFVDNPNTPDTDGPEIYAMLGVENNTIGNEDLPFLIVGGDFHIRLSEDPMVPPLQNLAVWFFDPNAGQYVWGTIGDANAPVRAFTIFDPGAFNVPGPPGATDAREFDDRSDAALIIGGDFTDIGGVGANRVASFNFTDGLQPLISFDDGSNGISNGSVRALTVYDPQDPGDGRDANPDEGLGPVRDPHDAPATLIIGGNFTKTAQRIPGEAATVTTSGIVTWNGNNFGPLAYGANVNGAGVSGGQATVFALEVYNPPEPEGEEDTGDLLYVGGNFTTLNGVMVNNLAQFGRIDADAPHQDPEFAGYNPQLLVDPIGVGGTVFALERWDIPDLAGEEMPEVLAIGGAFTDIGNNVGFFDGAGLGALGAGFDAPVRALQAMSDEQELLIPPVEGVDDNRQVLFAGGDFTQILTDPPTTAQGIAQFDVRLTPMGYAFSWFAMKTGVADAAGNPGSVHALAVFDDQNPQFDNSGDQWDRNDRPGTRLRLTVSPTTDSFANMFVRIYDSSYNLVAIYENDTISPIAPDPAGSLDPSLTPGTADAITGIEVWAGETYYIEVSAAGTGRYEVTVVVDGMPPEDERFDPTDGVLQDVISTHVEGIDATRFDLAQNRQFILDFLTGDDSVLRNAHDDFDGATPTFDFRNLDTTPTLIARQHRSDLGMIHSLNDTDMYAFRAPGVGLNFVEIRLSTAAIFDTFAEALDDITTPGIDEVVLKEKLLTSFFDGALRVFNNDFVQIGFNDDNPAVDGEYDVGFAGTFDNVTFFHRDPRIVIPVMGGEIYYIQVESGQLRNVVVDEETGEQDTSKVDWRMAIGGYQLIVNAVPDFTFDGDDDHQNAPPGDINLNTAQLSTVIPINIERNSDQNGRGTASGRIDHTPANPVDTDVFQYIAVHSGIMQVRVSAAAGSALAPQIVIFDQNFDPVATATGAAGGTAVTAVAGDRGEKFYISIGGAGNSEGAYNIVLQAVDTNFNPVTPAVVDDHVDFGSWLNATEIDIDRFGGRGTAEGRLEDTADTDVFRFTATSYEIATVTVTSQTPGFRPSLLIYEVGADPLGNPVFLQIGEDRAGLAVADSLFSTTPGREYYVIVLGNNIETDFGSYLVDVDLRATDDHPNLEDLPAATLIPIDYDAGTGFGEGEATGEIEVETDTDLFRFVSPRTGEAHITVSTPDSPLAVRIRIIDPSTGDTLMLPDGSLAMAEGENGTATLTLEDDVFILGREFYLVVEAGVAGPGQPELTGAYTVSIATAPADDHADEGDPLAEATPLVLDPNLGTASAEGLIFPDSDTDLFTFTTLASGRVRINVTTPVSTLAPAVRVLAADGLTVVTAASTQDGNTVFVEFNATDANQRYYIVVLPAAGTVTQTGAYTVAVQASTGLDDHANAGEWDDATVVTLDVRKADGQVNGTIDFAGDTDLFVFTALDSGPARVQVVVPLGSTLNGSVRIFNASRTQIAFNSQGLPGSTANLTFQAVAGQQYFVLVEPEAGTQGDYTLRLDAEPEVHYLYHPEGYTSDLISEFIPLVNPNDFDVTYTIIARYEVGERDQVIATGTIAANSRGGITINDRFDASKRLVRPDTPYALEIQSDGPLGATLSHYDFGITTGENFTDTLSTTWTFAEAHRDADVFRDFLVFYNPNDVATVVHVKQVYDNGVVNEFDITVDAFRRGGVNFTTNDMVHVDGRFGLIVTSNVPIVAALTSFDIAANRGYGVLGQAGLGATEGAIPLLEVADDVESGLSIFNAGSTATEVTIRAMYARVDLADLVRTITVAPNTTVRLTSTALGLVNGVPTSISYTSDSPVTVNAFEFQHGDGNATAASVAAGTTFLFGDAFVNPAFAGITYIENLAVFNPTDVNTTITLTFLFTDGTTATSNVTVQANDFAHISIDQQPAILNRVAPTAFSLRVDSTVPVLTSFVHYDLFLNGGWSAIGSPIGFTNDVATI